MKILALDDDSMSGRRVSGVMARPCLLDNLNMHSDLDEIQDAARPGFRSAETPQGPAAKAARSSRSAMRAPRHHAMAENWQRPLARPIMLASRPIRSAWSQ